MPFQSCHFLFLGSSSSSPGPASRHRWLTRSPTALPARRRGLRGHIIANNAVAATDTSAPGLKYSVCLVYRYLVCGVYYQRQAVLEAIADREKRGQSTWRSVQPAGNGLARERESCMRSYSASLR